MDVTPTAAESAVNRNDPGRADLAQGDPIVQPMKRDRATHSTNAYRSGTPAGKTSTCPARATDIQ